MEICSDRCVGDWQVTVIDKKKNGKVGQKDVPFGVKCEYPLNFKRLVL